MLHPPIRININPTKIHLKQLHQREVGQAQSKRHDSIVLPKYTLSHFELSCHSWCYIGMLFGDVYLVKNVGGVPAKGGNSGHAD